MLTGNGRTATYTSFDMPVTISKAGSSDTFVYGPEHQRVKRQTSTATTIYVNPDNSGGLAYEKDMTSGGATIEERVFVSAGSDPVVMLKRANGTGSFAPYYLHRDNIGSTVAITSSSGALLEQTAYEPFGKRRAPDGTSDPTNAIKGVNSDRGFTDHEHLDDLALVHMNGRIFDPLVGRFLSADPNVQFNDDLQSYNRYSYVSNNPLNARDPTGYFSFRSFFGDVEVAGRGLNKFSLKNDPLRRYATQYLGTHQWALTLVETVAAAATATNCECGAAVVAADVTYARTGSLGAGLKQGAITYTVNVVASGVGGGGSPGLNSGLTAKLFFTTVEHNFEEAEIQTLFAKIARQNGVSLLEVDAILEGVSILGDSLLNSDRIEGPDNPRHLGYVVINGILTRGPFPGSSLPFDIADVALGLQGLPTGTSLDFAANYAGYNVEGHSLGAIDASNLFALGAASKAKFYALPFPLTAPVGPNSSVTNSLWDIVPGLALGIITNPGARIINLPFLDHRHGDYRDADPVNF
jgi:RHS repeat-associated protein